MRNFCVLELCNLIYCAPVSMYTCILSAILELFHYMYHALSLVHNMTLVSAYCCERRGNTGTDSISISALCRQR